MSQQETLFTSNSLKSGSDSKRFSGWWMVLAATGVLFISSGIGFYGHSVILDPLRDQFGWSKASISFAITIYFITAGFMGLVVGRWTDIYGPKIIMVAGSILFGLCIIALPHITALWHLYLLYFVMSIGWSGMSLMVVSTLIANWFIRKRGIAMSFAMTGLSVGGVVLVPLLSYMIRGWGLKTAMAWLGVIAWAVVIPAAVFVIKQRPSDLGQYPDGLPPEENAETAIEDEALYQAQMRVWTRREAMGTMAFWAIVVAYWLALTGQIAFLMHQVSFLSEYVGAQGAATMVSITAAASIAGRLFLGSIADRYDKRYFTIICFMFQASALLLMSFFNQVGFLYLGTFLFGLSMGSVIMMQSLIIGECFGLVSFGTVMGAIMLFSSLGSAFGPLMAGFIFDKTQSYQIAFILFALGSLLASMIILLAKPPKQAELN